MIKVQFIITDAYEAILETVLEQEDIKGTTDKLSLRVVQCLLINGYHEVLVRYRLPESRLQVRILRNSNAVDDAYITFDKYVQDKCRNLVTSMYRTRDLELARSAIESNESAKAVE